MRHYYLPAHTYVCEIDNGAIFLDLRRGRYLGLDGQHVGVLRALVPNWPNRETATHESESILSDASCVIADALMAEGLLTRLGATAKFTATTLSVANEAIEFEGGEESSFTIRIQHILRFVAAAFGSFIKLRFFSLERLIEELQLKKDILHKQARAIDDAHLRELVHAFRYLRSWFYTGRDKCLFDSVALVDFLYRHRVIATFAMGVTTKPFGAHSWVQREQLILNDTVEHVQDFIPILMT